MGAALQIRLLGGIQIAENGVPLTHFVSNKAPALLAYLAVARRPHQREALAALLWGELPDADAKNNLRQALSSLRRALDPYLLITRDTAALNPQADVFLDVQAFEACLRAGTGDLQAEARAARLQEAAELYQGDFLAGFVVRDAPEFEDWMLAQRSRLRELALHALHRLTEHHLQRGRAAHAIDSAARLLAIDSWREEAHRQLMLALARSGQRAAALRQYETCRRILEKELGVQPAAETTALYERIRAAGEALRHAPPAPAAPLIGRAQELDEVLARLRDPHCRLLTLTGLGGSGKTRLAQEAAAHLQRELLNGACFAPLAAVADGARLPYALAEALRLPGLGENAAEDVLAYLAEKELLLALDNFEHLAEEDACIEFLAALLERAPGVKALVTSRERLAMQSEWVIEIKPLSGADAAAVFRYYAGRAAPPAAVLSAEAQPAILRVCELAGGLPLALALAAGWTRLMSLAEIAAALERDMALLASAMRDAPARHRSMQAVFDHSWRLLGPEEARALAALSVFQAGFTAAAAQAVAGASPALLAALLDKSWVQRGANQRFDLHQLVRQYARGRLAEPECALERHCEYFAAAQAAREPHVRTARQMEVFGEMRAEAEDICLMWQTAVQGRRVEALDKALHSTFWMFDVTGRHQEGVRLFGEAAERLKDRPGCEAARGRLLARQGALARLISDYALAEALLAEAETLSRAAGDAANQAYAARILGFFPLVRGELEAARARLEESVRLYRAVQDRPREADALLSLGIAESRLGNLARAAQLHQEAADILREAGDEIGLAVAHDNLGDVARYAGDLAGAAAHYRAAAEIQRRCDDRRDLAVSLNAIAGVLNELGQWEEAAAAAQESADLFRERGSRDGLMQALQSMAGALLGRGEVEQALRVFDEALALGMQLNAEADLLPLLVFGARLLQARGQAGEAARLLAAIQRSPAASAFTAQSAQAALRALPAEIAARAAEAGDARTGLQLAEALRRAAARPVYAGAPRLS